MYKDVSLSFVIQEFYLGENVTEENRNYCTKSLPSCCNGRRLLILAHTNCKRHHDSIGLPIDFNCRSQKMTSTWEAMQSRDTLMHSEIINTSSSPNNSPFSIRLLDLSESLIPFSGLNILLNYVLVSGIDNAILPYDCFLSHIPST